MRNLNSCLLGLAVSFAFVGCGSPSDAPPPISGTGGRGAAGALGSGGTALGSGGTALGSGGTAPTSGGAATSGGAVGSGGAPAHGGSTGSGGSAGSVNPFSGGVAGSTNGSGGSPAKGGTANSSGGRTNSGGSAQSGGTAGTTTGSGGGPTPTGCTPPSDYPNLFVTIAGHTQADVDAKIAAAWNQLYNPSNANTVYYDGPGADESYVKDTGNNDVRTEGMSYGMMTALQLDKQKEFDRLWTWVKNHMTNGTGEISWQCSTSGSKMSNGGAPDGEEYMATALIFAHKRWGDSGKFKYASEAQWVLDLIRTKYFNASYHIIKFVANSNNTDGSYVLPAFYQAWACFDTANAAFWNEAISAGRKFFHSAADSNGVIPDQSSFTGQAQGSAGSDAKRCVMNIMMDANFFGVDAWQTDTYAPAFASYMTSHGDGTAAQFSCNALLGFGLPAATGKPFLDKLWSAAIPTGQWRYYDGTLYTLSLLHVSGAFKLYY